MPSGFCEHPCCNPVWHHVLSRASANDLLVHAEQAQTGASISTLTSQLQGATASGALLNQLSASGIPATNVSLLDAVPVSQSPGSGSNGPSPRSDTGELPQA